MLKSREEGWALETGCWVRRPAGMFQGDTVVDNSGNLAQVKPRCLSAALASHRHSS